MFSKSALLLAIVNVFTIFYYFSFWNPSCRELKNVRLISNIVREEDSVSLTNEKGTTPHSEVIFLNCKLNLLPYIDFSFWSLGTDVINYKLQLRLLSHKTFAGFSVLTIFSEYRILRTCSRQTRRKW